MWFNYFQLFSIIFIFQVDKIHREETAVHKERQTVCSLDTGVKFEIYPRE